MTTLVPVALAEPFYPSADGEPVAETYDHLYALLTTLEVLKQYLAGRQATVLGDQFLYYAQGYPRLRVAPDVMVILDVPPGGRDNYKIWEEGQVPAVIFEMTSAGTKDEDQMFKKILYEQLGVQEYWLFDPKGEWVQEKLRGYRLDGERYRPVQGARSEVLQLRLEIEGKLIGFYRDTGEKLLVPEELAEALKQEVVVRQQAEAQAEQERQRAEQAELQVEQAELQVEQERQRAKQERQRAEQAELQVEQAELQVEQERQRAEQERQRAEQAELQVEQLKAQLRTLRIDTDTV